MKLSPDTFLNSISLILSTFSFITMLVLVGMNIQNEIIQYNNNVNILLFNVTDITNHIPATLACQSMIPILNQEYLNCVSDGNLECSTKSTMEINLNTAINSLNSTKSEIQTSCTNRTNALLLEIANFTSFDNYTILKFGTMPVSVTGAATFFAGYEHKRVILGGELKVDFLILKAWANSVVTAALDPVITYTGFTVLNNGKIPFLLSDVYVGANVTAIKGIQFFVKGTVSPALKMYKDLAIQL
jgi:hypothetical protein